MQREETSESDCSLSLSCESSEFEEDIDVDNEGERLQLGVAPYLFEPTYSDSDEIPESDEENEQELRLGNTDWCVCQHCIPCETATECKCCEEIPEIKAKMYDHHLTCITQHPGFEAAVLNRYTLEIGYLAYNQQYGVELADKPERYRYTAYRQLVRWMWGYLGKEIRVVLPSCAVQKIRHAYPCPQGQEYKGFRAPVD